MSGLSFFKDAPDKAPVLVRVCRVSELKDGDMLVFNADAFTLPKHFVSAAEEMILEARKHGIELSQQILICRPGHSEDFFYIDEKHLNECGFYRK